jgi:hypothetical protein
MRCRAGGERCGVGGKREASDSDSWEGEGAAGSRLVGEGEGVRVS